MQDTFLVNGCLRHHSNSIHRQSIYYNLNELLQHHCPKLPNLCYSIVVWHCLAVGGDGLNSTIRFWVALLLEIVIVSTAGHALFEEDPQGYSQPICVPNLVGLYLDSYFC